MVYGLAHTETRRHGDSELVAGGGLEAQGFNRGVNEGRVSGSFLAEVPLTPNGQYVVSLLY